MNLNLFFFTLRAKKKFKSIFYLYDGFTNKSSLQHTQILEIVFCTSFRFLTVSAWSKSLFIFSWWRKKITFDSLLSWFGCEIFIFQIIPKIIRMRIQSKSIFWHYMFLCTQLYCCSVANQTNDQHHSRIFELRDQLNGHQYLVLID